MHQSWMRLLDHAFSEVHVRDHLKAQGYSKEDEYFHRKDREIIEKLRQKAQAQRTRLGSENEDKEYWMRCPKCGAGLKEKTMETLFSLTAALPKNAVESSLTEANSKFS